MNQAMLKTRSRKLKEKMEDENYLESSYARQNKKDENSKKMDVRRIN